MAATASPQADYSANTAALDASLSQQVAQAWARLLDTSDLAASVPQLSAGIAALVHRYGSAQALAAAQYYRQVRELAGVAGRFVPKQPDPPPPQQVAAAVSWATRNLWTADPDPAPALVMVQGAAQRLALDTGRDTLLDAVRSDRQARGWAREPRLDCCAFCAMLATRGAVYGSKKSAMFQAHDHDHCTPVPVFGPYEPPAHVREWEAMWRSSTRGKSGAEARRAFRAAFEGRALKPTKAQKAKAALPAAKSGKPQQQARAELAALTRSHAALEASGSNPAAEKWQRDRIARLKGDLGE